MLKKIDINLGYFGWAKTWAWVDGVYAIHKSGDEWLLTHVPTGMGIGRDYRNPCISKKKILKKLEKYKQLRWRGINPFEDLESCELLNLAPLIHDDLAGTEFNPHKVSGAAWKQVQVEAAQALDCKVRDKR